MVLSLIITPAVYYFLNRNGQAVANEPSAIDWQRNSVA
jgi:hypothetical protein